MKWRGSLAIFIGALWPFFLFLIGCGQRSGEEGSAGLKVFLALGICLAAVFLIFYIVVKGREKD